MGESHAYDVLVVGGRNSAVESSLDMYRNGSRVTLVHRGAKLSEGVKVSKAGKRDMRVIEGLVREFCGYFGNDYADVMGKQFYRITPMSKRPYEKLYSY
jgi:hypothetical protein